MNSNPYEFDFRTYDRWRPSLLQSFRQLLHRFGQAGRMRHEIQSLHELSDNMLEDIGLTRTDLSDDRRLSRAAESRLRSPQ